MSSVETLVKVNVGNRRTAVVDNVGRRNSIRRIGSNSEGISFLFHLLLLDL